MKICVSVRIGECRALLRQNLDSRFDFGMERHVGWVIGYFFSMSYHSGDEVGLYYLLVFHKALTDPVSLLLLFVVSFLIIWFAWEGKGAPISACLYLSLLCTILVAGVTYCVSAFSPKGRKAQGKLKGTLRNLLTNMKGV